MVLVVRRGALRSGAVMGFGGREVVVKVATAVRLAARGQRRGRGQGSSVKRPVVERPRGPRARGCLLWPGRLSGLHPRRFPDSRFQTPRLDASGAGRGLGQDLGLYATGPIALPQPGWAGGSAYGGTAGRRAMQARPGQCTMRRKMLWWLHHGWPRGWKGPAPVAEEEKKRKRSIASGKDTSKRCLFLSSCGKVTFRSVLQAG